MPDITPFSLESHKDPVGEIQPSPLHRWDKEGAESTSLVHRHRESEGRLAFEIKDVASLKKQNGKQAGSGGWGYGARGNLNFHLWNCYFFESVLTLVSSQHPHMNLAHSNFGLCWQNSWSHQHELELLSQTISIHFSDKIVHSQTHRDPWPTPTTDSTVSLLSPVCHPEFFFPPEDTDHYSSKQ